MSDEKKPARPVSPRLAQIQAKYPPLKRDQLVDHVPGDIVKIVTADGRVYNRGQHWMTLVNSNEGPRPTTIDAAKVEHIIEEEGDGAYPDMIVIRGLPNTAKPDRKFYKDQGPVVRIPINFCVEIVQDPLEQQLIAEINADRNESLDAAKDKPGAADDEGAEGDESGEEEGD